VLRCWRESFDLSFCFLVSLRGGEDGGGGVRGVKGVGGGELVVGWYGVGSGRWGMGDWGMVWGLARRGRGWSVWLVLIFVA